jgi:hypothetical protein
MRLYACYEILIFRFELFTNVIKQSKFIAARHASHCVYILDTCSIHIHRFMIKAPFPAHKQLSLSGTGSDSIHDEKIIRSHKNKSFFNDEIFHVNFIYSARSLRAQRFSRVSCFMATEIYSFACRHCFL